MLAGKLACDLTLPSISPHPSSLVLAFLFRFFAIILSHSSRSRPRARIHTHTFTQTYDLYRGTKYRPAQSIAGCRIRGTEYKLMCWMLKYCSANTHLYHIMVTVPAYSLTLAVNSRKIFYYFSITYTTNLLMIIYIDIK